MIFVLVFGIGLWISRASTSLVFDYLDDLDCPPGGQYFYNTTLSPYYYDAEENFHVDDHFNEVSSMEDFLGGTQSYVTVAVDNELRIPYGTRVCIASVNQHLKEYIPFELRDSHPDLAHRGFQNLQVFVKSKENSNYLNDKVDIAVYF